MLAPVGARRASWSRVMASPPAAMMRARAVAVKRRAAMVALGNSSRRLSSVTVPMMTTVRFSSLVVLATMRDRETGGRLILDMNRRRRTTLLKEESVRPGEKSLAVSGLPIVTGTEGERKRTGQEAVELHQELEVDIVAFGGTAVSALDVVAVKIDTCFVGEAIVSHLVQACSKTGDSVFRGKRERWCLGRSEKDSRKRSLSLLAYRRLLSQLLHVPMAAVVWRLVEVGDAAG